MEIFKPRFLKRRIEVGVREFYWPSLLTFTNLLRLSWILLICWGERHVYHSSMSACQWENWESWVFSYLHSFLIEIL